MSENIIETYEKHIHDEHNVINRVSKLFSNKYHNNMMVNI